MSETTPNANPTRRRGRVLLVCALLVATLTGGLAARRATGPDPLATGGGGPLHLAAPAGHPVRFHAQLDRGSVLQGSDGLVRMELVMAGEERQETSSPRVPTDLVVILDRSGSMQGEALRFAKAAVAELVSRLGDEDRFALVTYANGASMTLPLAEASGAARGRWLAAVEAIRADGGTNMASGIDLANRAIGSARQPGRATRLILLSDGHANQGDHSLEGLRARAARAVAGEWVLSAVGVGQGFDENVMSAIADAGTGNFYYLPHIRELAGVFDDEFAAARETVASALAVGFELEEGVELVEAAGYPRHRPRGPARSRSAASPSSTAGRAAGARSWPWRVDRRSPAWPRRRTTTPRSTRRAGGGAIGSTGPTSSRSRWRASSSPASERRPSPR
jgi:Ca-activated chloride channel family protein